ncbi:MAG: T9SS type A sorting domain-containing protein [Bacteroidota bacterium]
MNKIKTKRILFLALVLMSLNAKAQWTAICNSGNGFVDNFEIFNGELYATGFFNTVCGTTCNYVSKFNGTSWQAVGNGFLHAGHHLKNIDSVLYGVSYQPQIDSNWLYKFDGTDFTKLGDGTYLTTAVTGFSQTNNLYNIIKYNGNIVVCGEFDRVGSKNIYGIMQWNGTQWDSLGSGLSGNITGTAPVMYPHDLCIFGTDLIVSGNFRLAGGQTVNGVARWDGTQWHAMGQGFNSVAYAVCEFDGELYAGGDFTMSGTNQLQYIAKWNGTDWIDPGFSLFYNSPSNYSFIHTLKVMNDRLYISGGFDRALFGLDTMQCQAVVAYDGISIDTLGGGTIGNEVEALAIYNGLLYAGGGPNNNSSYIANYSLSTDIKDDTKLSKLISIFPNPTTGGFSISQPTEVAEICIRDIYGKMIYKTRTTQKITDFEHDINGVYIVYVETKEGTSVQKLIINR